MGQYLIKRLLLLTPSLILVCAIVFALMRMVPGSAVDLVWNRLLDVGLMVEKADVEAMLGMDKPALQQFWIWFGNALHGDLGNSLFQNEPVASIIGRQLPISLELGILMLIFSNLISIPLGLYCAAHQDTITDYAVRIVAIVLMAAPIFWIATLILIYPAKWWGYAPPMTYVGFFEDPVANLRMFLPPALLGAVTQSGMQLRTVRTITLDVMRNDFIRASWAKGLGERAVMYSHAFRNSMIPIVTMVGSGVTMMIGGSVILESLFTIPGIGAQIVTALGTRDYPVVQGCVLIYAVIAMVVNLIVDICYKWIDPRVTLE
jgi:peptide/nickel transport system permease protein